MVDFLLLDPEFPRSVFFCIERAEASVHAITGTPPGSFRNSAERRIGQLRSELAYAQVHDIITAGLHEFLDNFQAQLNRVGDAISETFFGWQTQSQSAVSAGAGGQE